MKIRYLLVAAMCMVQCSASAQRLLGIATCNWNTTSSLYLNPANPADSRCKFSVDILAVNAFADNNMGVISKDKVATDIGAGTSLAMNRILDFKKYSGNVMAPYAEVRGPGFMWNIDHVNSLAFTTRVRYNSQFTGINRPMFQSAIDNGYAKGGGSSYTTAGNGFRWNSALWSELGLTYSRVLISLDENFLSVGITARYLGALSYNSLAVNNADADYNANYDSLRLTHTNMKYSSGAYDPNSNKAGGGARSMLGRFLGKGVGSGLGADLGVSYEYRPDYAAYMYRMDGKTGIMDYGVPRYKLRLSAAVTDIGSLHFKAASNQTVEVSGNGYSINNELSKNIYNYTDFKSYMKGHGFTVADAAGAGSYHMPTALVLGADYKVWRDFYANVTSITNLANHDAVGAYYYSQVTFTPRYDNLLYSIGVPISYNFMSRSVKAGIGVCMAGFFIGSDDLLMLASDHQYGFNAYLGGYVPVNYRKPPDRDGDRISDKKDLCPDVFGLWEFYGCPDPDRDHDGIPDSVDKCPSLAGVPSAQGCPDKDGDGIADSADRCPSEPGLPALQGCPDRDGDGIADIDDACPDAKGLEKFKGCPDADDDGIPDNDDTCPLVKGPEKYKGCPDTDGDGVPDNLDKCPTVPGLVTNNGCPEKILTEDSVTVAKAVTDLKFETGNAVIKKSSFTLLKELVVTLNDNKDYYLVIDGYTDNVGTDEHNLELSKARANAVKTWLVKKHIAPDRLVTNGFGNTNPVGDNTTEEGRSKNRRVKMTFRRK